MIRAAILLGYWGWTLVFALVVALGFLPHIAWPFAKALVEGEVPLGMGAMILAFMVMPFASAVLVVEKVRGDHVKLLRLFLAVQAPLMILCLFRIFALRQTTTAVMHLGVMLGGGLVAHAFSLFREDDEARPAAVWTQLIAHIHLVIAGAWLVLVTMFFVPPAVVGFLSSLSLQPLRNILDAPPSFFLFGLLGLSLFLGTFAAWVCMPFVMVYSTLRAIAVWWTRAVKHSGAITVSVVTIAIVFFNGLLQGITTPQDQRAVIALLSTPPRDNDERRALLSQQDRIREGLLNAYLAGHRYLGATGDETAIPSMYQHVMHLDEASAKSVGRAFDALIAPFLYDGATLTSDRDTAERLYEQFFDAPIQKGEQRAIIAALSSTYDSAQREAGLLDASERRVHTRSQDITITEGPTTADIEIHEVYVNRTLEPLEIQLRFTLPDTAVLTGMDLGDGTGLRIQSAVSPRGAAQKVYRDEVRRRVDPSLLEQVGPRQFRLRAFPIPAAPRRDDEGKPLELWIRYRVLRESHGYAAPVLVDQRNVFIDGDTKRTLNGKSFDEEAWLPARFPSEQPVPQRIVLGVDGQRQIAATWMHEPAGLPQFRTFAVVVDRSKSMEANRTELLDALRALRREPLAQNQVHLFLTSGPHRGERPQKLETWGDFEEKDVIFFGAHTPDGMLGEFQSLADGQKYDAIFLLTDAGSFDLAQDRPAVRELGAPLWIVHLGKKLAPAYDDSTTSLLYKSGGGVETSLIRALRQFEARRANPSLLALDEPIAFALAAGETPTSDDDALPIMVRHLLTARMRDTAAITTEEMDAMHALAVKHGIVTPFSSRIALVDERQWEALRQAEQADDRFEREVEHGKESVSTPTTGLLKASATPEPAEWLLMLLAAVAAWVALRWRPESAA